MKNIKDFYNQTAAEWADKWYEDETLLPYLKEFINYLPQNPRILDLCCGAGYESMRMQKLGADVTGLNFSEESIRMAKVLLIDKESSWEYYILKKYLIYLY